MDCGQCHSHVLNTKTNTYHKIEHSFIVDLNIPGLENGDRIIVEEAHLRSQEDNSLAQPFTYDQLKTIKSNAHTRNIEIRLFPQKCSPTARKVASLEYPDLLDKTDENDIRAIAYFIKASPNSFTHLKKFNPINNEDYQKKNASKFLDRIELNGDINPARNLKYGIKNAYGHTDAVTEFIKHHVSTLASEIGDEDILEFFGIILNKKKSALLPSVIQYKNDKLKRLYNVVLTILKPDGSLRLRSDVGKPAFWKYAKEVYFGITPYHMNAGVVASNWKWHLRKASSPCKYSLSLESKKPMKLLDHYNEIKNARRESDKKLQVLWTTLRKMIVEDGLR